MIHLLANLNKALRLSKIDGVQVVPFLGVLLMETDLLSFLQAGLGFLELLNYLTIQLLQNGNSVSPFNI